jgi:predicted metalloprotease with PDZ domain
MRSRLPRLLVFLALYCIVALPSGAPAAEGFNGTILLNVDASDVQRRIFRVTETIPAQPGAFGLYYPQWLPGKHAARGTIDQLTGLRFRVNGSEVPWRRDPLDVFHLLLDLPAGTRALDIEFQVATPQASDAGRIVVTNDMLNLQWEQVLLYPAGVAARDIPVQATLRLPAGWQHASALRPAAGTPADAQPAVFDTVPLEVLVDSPLFAGRYFRKVDLTPAGSAPVTLNIVADNAGDLAITDEQLAIHRAMVREVHAALGPPRYDRYDFLLALTDSLGGIGLEHHRSSENSQGTGYFRSWDEAVTDRDLLAHEFTHSWNGKYVRPARLWTPHYNTPMQDDLLWVYEGLTQYYGLVLAVRAGLVPQDVMRDELAAVAGTYAEKRPGRDWRPLEDTTFQPIVTPRRPLSWVSWQRSEDYYTEGALLWLDIDTRLRELTRGRRSLDDFARAFFARPATQGWVATYELADVASALNAVAPFEWAQLLRERTTGLRQPLLEGVERAGFRLVFTDQPNKAIADVERSARRTDLGYSLGIVVSRDSVLTEVVWDSPAFRAGLTTNTTLVAVNGRAYSAELLKRAVTDAASGGPPVELIVKKQDLFRTVTLDYRGGLRYPHFTPIAGRPDGLATLFAPRAALAGRQPIALK